jgi:predicted transport protein
MASVMRFVIRDPLLTILRARRARQEARYPGEGQKDAILIYPGLGPALYLTLDRRVLIDARDWDGSPIREASDEDAIGAIVVGVRSTGIRELLDLLPSAPANARPCAVCRGERYDEGIVCSSCFGLGWTVPTGIALLALCESVRAYVSQLGSDVEQSVNKEVATFSRLGLPFARVYHRPYPERVIIFARVDPSSVGLEEGFTRDVSRGEWLLVPFEDRTRDLEISVRSTDDFEKAKPLIRQAHEG